MRTSVACLALFCAALLLVSEVHASRDLLAKGGNGKGRGNGGQGGQGQGGQGGGRGKPVRVCPFPCATCNGNSTNCKTCTTGFALQGNRCIECTDARGMVVSTKGRCQCKLGLEFNKDKTQCVAPTAAEAETD